MKTEFTPGPWLISENDPAFVYSLNSQGTNHFWLKLYAQHDGATQQETAANATLIAAAPNLYAALLPFVEHGTCCEPEHVDAARAALAKARGEQP